MEGCLRILAFGDWINGLSLIDMGFKGGKYTWRRGQVESTVVAKRLDRVFCCGHARLKRQEAVVSHLPFLSSDHTPLYLQLQPQQGMDPRRRPFRFEAAWLTHDGFKDLLSTSWDPSLSTPAALTKLKMRLKKWNREVLGDLHMRKERLATELKEVQDFLDVAQSDDLLAREAALLRSFDALLEQEEVLWFRKSREKYIELGDRNTSFFHISTVIRRRRNKIEMLKDAEGKWVSDKGELESLAIQYYKGLYSLADLSVDKYKLPVEGFTLLSATDQRQLNKPFTSEEVEVAVRSMSRYKAPGQMVTSRFSTNIAGRRWEAQ